MASRGGARPDPARAPGHAGRQLRTAVDQLRTAAEEHSASYEELLSLNEELQSSNEEIEASKEELQSLNEELTTINGQLEEKNEELRSLTYDLNNLLVSANVATVFLDRELRIRRFTPACATVMRIVPADVGRRLCATSRCRSTTSALLADALRVLDQPRRSRPRSPPTTVDGSCDGSCPTAPRRSIDGVCLTFHEITVQKQAAAASEYARLYAEAIIRTSRTPLARARHGPPPGVGQRGVLRHVPGRREGDRGPADLRARQRAMGHPPGAAAAGGGSRSRVRRSATTTSTTSSSGSAGAACGSTPTSCRATAAPTSSWCRSRT